jgi:hypothetical protein
MTLFPRIFVQKFWLPRASSHAQDPADRHWWLLWGAKCQVHRVDVLPRLGLPTVCSHWCQVVVRQHQVGFNEGEMVVTAVSAYLVEDDALYFDVHWDNGTTSEEPLEALVDADGTVNTKLVEYANAQELDLTPYLDILLPIIRGERDSYHSSGGD